jgi:hypothetical protein
VSDRCGRVGGRDVHGRRGGGGGGAAIDERAEHR